jgi:hypothetical protein
MPCLPAFGLSILLYWVRSTRLGHRKITLFRLIRPLLLAAGIVLLYLKKVGTTGNGLAFELVLLVLGLGLGIAAGFLFRSTGTKGSHGAGPAFLMRLSGLRLSAPDLDLSMPPLIPHHSIGG